MIIKSLNSFPLIMAMVTFAMLSISQSNGDNHDSILFRSRRQVEQIKYMQACRDECILSQIDAVVQHVYTLNELRKMCSAGCQKEANNLHANSKQQKIQEYYHHPPQSMSSTKVDCELKCLANSLNFKQRKDFCRNKCSAI